MKTRGAAIGFLLLLTGCAHHPPPAPVAEAPKLVPQVTSDGTYIGPSRLMQADGRHCPRSTTVSVTVFDRAFDVKYREGSVPVPVHASIAPDNSISGGDGIVQIQGKLDGSVLNLTVQNDQCQSHMVLRRQ